MIENRGTLGTAKRHQVLLRQTRQGFLRED